MFARLLFLFIALPLVEIAILVKMGEVLGFWNTIAIVILTGILGASLARYQGFMVYNKIQQELQAGRVPAGELVDGLLILVGGVVLLTPGLITDISGFLLLVPWFRKIVKRWLQHKFENMVQSRHTFISYSDKL